MFIQQGDVLIRSVDKIPSDITKFNKDHRGYVLAEGEHTGHYHGVVCDDDVIEMYKNNENNFLYINNTDSITVTHQEHKPVVIPPGSWEISYVQEYDHFAEEARNVRD